MVHVEVLVRSETADKDDAGLARRHVAVLFVELSVCWVRDRVVRFSVVARVLFEDDGAGGRARRFGLVGFVLVLDNSRVLHLWSWVVELEARLVKPTFRFVVLFEKPKASVFELW